MKTQDSFETVCQRLTRQQVQAVVEAYLNIEAQRTQLAAVSGEPEPWTVGAVDILKAGHEELAPPLAYLRRVCDAYAARSQATHWVQSMPAFGGVTAAGLGAATVHVEILSTDHLHRLCGLHPAVQQLTPVDANRLYERIHRDSAAITVPEARALAATTGRSIRSIWKGDQRITKEEVLEWLVRPPYIEVLYRLMARAGKRLAMQKGSYDNRYSRLYHERLGQEARMNEIGAYEDRAKQEYRRAKTACAEEREQYRRGRLPLRQLQELAKRWALRQFLSDYYRRLKETGGIGNEPVPDV